jgi:hypothetical protein
MLSGDITRGGEGTLPIQNFAPRVPEKCNSLSLQHINLYVAIHVLL